MARYKQLRVEEWLKETDYRFVGYMPQKEAFMFVNFIKEVNAGSEENETPLVHLKMMDRVFNKDRRCAILCHRGIGKALSLDSTLYTDTDLITIRDVQVGDNIADEEGNFSKVLTKSEVFNKPMYELLLGDNRKIEVSEDHINVILHRRQKRINGKQVWYLDRRNIGTKDLLDIKLYSTRTKTPKNPKGTEARVWIPTSKPVLYSKKDFSFDPYTMGLFLGDGSSDKQTGFLRITSGIKDISEYFNKIPYTIGTQRIDPRSQNTCTFGILKVGKTLKKLKVNVAGRYKFIPENYFFGSVNQRLELLQGLMDSDGTIDKHGNMSFSNNSYYLAEGIKRIVQSLGGIAIIYTKKESYNVSIRLNFNPFYLERKRKRFKPNAPEKIPLLAVNRIEDKLSQCISVDNATHTFLTNDYTVTHNTTLFGEYLILFIAAFGYFPGFGLVNLILYVTDSIENGVKNLRRNVEFRYGESDFLKKLIPDKRITVGTDGSGHVGIDDYEKSFATGRKFTDIRLEFRNNQGHILVVKGYGAKTGVRGAKELGKRPTIAVLDDLVSDTDAESSTVIKTIENTVYKAVSKALHPTNQKMVWLGTPFNARDPLYKAVESGAWRVSVYPICEHFPCTEAEFKGSWEDRFPYSYVKEEYDEAQALKLPENFNQELMLRIMSDEDRLIDDNQIKWYNRESLLKNKAAYNFYITTDFATSEEQASDFSVISVWGVNYKGQWFWVDGICKKQLMDKNLDDLFRLAQKWKPLSVGIEVSGQQQGFTSIVERDMLDRNISFYLATENNMNKPGIRPNTNKMVRFMMVLPWFKQGKMFFPEELRYDDEMMECMEELGLASKGGFKSKHDDFIDSISMLGSLIVFRPSEQTVPMHKGIEGIWNFQEEEETGGMDSYVV